MVGKPHAPHQVATYERTGGDAGASYALMIFNTNRDHDSSTSFEGSDMVVNQPDGTVLVDVLEGGSYTVGAGATLNVALAPQTAVLLVPQGDVVAGL